MGRMTVECRGATWQEDFAPVAEALYAALPRYFAGRRAPDDAVHQCVLLAMDGFRKHWTHGGTLHVWTYYHCRKVRSGRVWVHTTQQGRCVSPRAGQRFRPVSPRDRVDDAVFATYTDGDLVADARTLSRLHGRMVRDVLAGFSMRMLAAKYHLCDHTVSRKLRMVYAAISR